MKMNNNEKYLKEELEGFRHNRGRACTYCLPPFNPCELVYNVLFHYRNKTPNTKVYIVVEKFTMRLKLVEYFRDCGFNYGDVTIITKEYVSRSNAYINDMSIFIDIFDIDKIEQFASKGRFAFAIFTKNNLDSTFNIEVRKYLPEIITSVTNLGIVDLLKSPVEEYWINASLDDKDRTQYDKYTKHITETMTIFGSLDVVSKCRIGTQNMSAAQFREILAKQNGWSIDLDCSGEFNRQIDEMYNPNSLGEKAAFIYNLISERKRLVTDNECKLNEILNCIKTIGENKKILIINYRGEFANKVYNYLNKNGITCGNYHDEAETEFLRDECGEVITYKSGVNKGKPKPFKSSAISSFYLECFDNNRLNVLSCKNNMINTTKCKKVDAIIFTSPLCIPIDEFILKYIDIKIVTPIITYIIYCDNTIEYSKLKNKQIKDNIKICSDKSNAEFDAESGDVIL